MCSGAVFRGPKRAQGEAIVPPSYSHRTGQARPFPKSAATLSREPVRVTRGGVRKLIITVAQDRRPEFQRKHNNLY
jgi:hypothetical protein